MNNLSTLNFLNFFNFSQVFAVFKLGFLIADIFIVIFLLVVIKQVFSMDHIIHDSNDFNIIKTFAFILLLIAISLFVVSLVIL